MITKLVNKRTVTTSNGKTYSKAPKVQRLITPLRIRRKNLLKSLEKKILSIQENKRKNMKTHTKKEEKERKP